MHNSIKLLKKKARAVKWKQNTGKDGIRMQKEVTRGISFMSRFNPFTEDNQEFYKPSLRGFLTRLQEYVLLSVE